MGLISFDPPPGFHHPGDSLGACVRRARVRRLCVQCIHPGAYVGELAAGAKVAPDTIVRFERGERLRKRTVDSLRQVLEAAGLEFTDGRKPGV